MSAVVWFAAGAAVASLVWAVQADLVRRHAHRYARQAAIARLSALQEARAAHEGAELQHAQALAQGAQVAALVTGRSAALVELGLEGELVRTGWDVSQRKAQPTTPIGALGQADPARALAGS